MNWYKIAMLSDVEIFEDDENHGMSYLNIGHEGEGGYEYEKDFPNYIWTLIDGEIFSVEEDSEHMGHDENMFPGCNIDFETSFTGRFESSTGRLTVARPSGVSKFRPVPKNILFKLYQKFPGVRQIYVF